MGLNHLSRWFYFLLTISFLLLSLSEGKGFSGGRGGGGGLKGGSKGAGSFGGGSNYGRSNSYGSNMGKVRTGSSFKGKAMSFAAGAAGGIAAYSLMRSMTGSGSHYSRSGSYGPGYGVGETCVNNEDFNGTTFGQFRCPMNGFPYEAKKCCGEYGKQFCCIPERNFLRVASHYGWIVLVLIVLIIVALLWARHRRQRQGEVIMVPTDQPAEDKHGQPFYHPPPPPMGYPPPPNGNPYAVPPQNYPGNYNPYAQPSQMQYPPQQQQYNPY